MVRKGFVEQEIQALATALAKLLGLIRDRDFSGGQAELALVCKRLTGLDINTITTLPESALLSLLTSEGAFDAGRSVVTASLLREQAHIAEQEGRGDVAQASRRKALALLLEAGIAEKILHKEPYPAQVEALLASVSAPLSPPLQRRLFLWQEARGCFGKAEDALFALREKGVPGTDAEAVDFYERLLLQSDDALVTGGLPRDEVEEGLREAKRRTPAKTGS